MYDKTITVFNWCENKQAGTYLWCPSVLRGVDLNMDVAAMLAKYGAEAQDKVSLHVRHPNGTKPWLPPKAWRDQPQDKLQESLTFASGDFFWLGEWPNEEPVNDGAYEDGFFEYMSRRHDYVFRISAVSGPFTLVPHFEILGR